MVNHPHRSKPPDRPLEGAALARLLFKAENQTHEVSAKLLTRRELLTLVASPDLIASDGHRWKMTQVGREYAKAHDPYERDRPVDANRIWWLVKRLIGANNAEAEAACIEIGLEVSRSRIKGWDLHPGDRKHAKMTLEELEQVLLGLLALEGYSVAAGDGGGEDGA